MRLFSYDELEIGNVVYMNYMKQCAKVKIKENNQVRILNKIISPYSWGNMQDKLINVSWNTIFTSKPFDAKTCNPRMITSGILH